MSAAGGAQGEENMESIIVGLIILAAAVFAVYRLFFKRDCGCASDCDCSSSGKKPGDCDSGKGTDCGKDCGRGR